MEVKVILDKEAVNKDFQTAFGLSFLLSEKILFDTAEDGRKLIRNMEKMSVELDEIDKIIISHDHWDHTGGLWEILKKKKGIEIYTCPNFSAALKNRVKKMGGRLIENATFAELRKGIFVTGEIRGRYHGKYIAEQATVIKTEKGISVITGCAHPGIVEIVKIVKTKFPDEKIYAVFGGFHLGGHSLNDLAKTAEELKKMGVLKAGPSHCSGNAAEEVFKDIFKNNFISVRVGDTMTT